MIRLYPTLRTCIRPIVLGTRQLRGSGHGSMSFCVAPLSLIISCFLTDMPCNTMADGLCTPTFPVSVFRCHIMFCLAPLQSLCDNPDVIMISQNDELLS